MRQQVIQGLLAACVLAGCGGTTQERVEAGELVAPAGEAPQESIRYGAQVIPPTAWDLSKPLRELPVPPAQPPVERPRLQRPPSPSWLPPSGDPLIQRQPLPWKVSDPIINVEGMGQDFFGPSGPFQDMLVPADPAGDVGPHHYMQIVNAGISVFDKRGRVLFGPVPTRTLWEGFASPCANTNEGDGVIRYDHLADRWVVTQFSTGRRLGPFLECVAVSETGDPTGRYYRYAFEFEAFNDYPKLGLWPDAYYMTFNMETRTGDINARVCALERARMLKGEPAAMQCFDTLSVSLLPADLDGPVLPPPGEPNPVFGLGETSTLEMWRFHVDWDEPASSSLTGPLSIPVAPFSRLCGGGTCVPQPGFTSALASLGDRLMNRAPYRNFKSHQSVLLTHSVQADEDRGGMRWYELRHLESPTVYQQGTYAPDSHYRWMGSIAADAKGNIALGYSLSSRERFPSIHYTGRRASDLLGKMARENTLVKGRAAYERTRWGDYSSMNVDPVDGCTFWYTSMYINTPLPLEVAWEGGGDDDEVVPVNARWSTRLGSFRLADCDVMAPTLTLLSPSSGAIVRDEVDVLVEAEDDVGVTRVELYVDGRRVDTDEHAPYRLEWDSTEVPDGRHELLIKAHDAAGNVGQLSTSVIVANHDCGPAGQRLANPGFEEGLTGWSATGGVISSLTSPALPARTGAWRAWLGGYGEKHRDMLVQELTIPEEACAAELAFWVRINTSETAASSPSDTLRVRLLDSSGHGVATLARYSNLDAGPDYVLARVDLLRFRGKTLRLVFESEENASRATSFLIDDATLDVRLRSTPVSLGERSGASAPP
ncbi:Ig-like domain-containing protein [Archangium violaceum]|uniref:Ig-like domain-containing protein n=1 Tax=Archangium violaceum TaxID=83451 RepID=UPI00069756A3|nr:Ig-like domain-containing protein [Archangium violaceum]